MPFKFSALQSASVLLPLYATLLACNSGGGSPTPVSPSTVDTTAPIVSSTSPASGATAVARSSAVTATFNEDIFASTVTASSFTLLGGGAVAGSVSFNGAGNVATFTPSQRLGMLTSYTATLTTGITDLVGNALAANHVWSFTTADGAWGTAGLVETDNTGAARTPHVAIDASGHGLSVWSQYDGIRYNVWANRYTAGAGWGIPELIETVDTGSAASPRVGLDASGNGVAVWQQHDGVRNNIWTNRYTAGSGWGTAELLETDDVGPANNPQIAVNATGQAVAVWDQSDGGRQNIWARRYTPGSGWAAAELVETNHADNAALPQVAVDPNGNAYAVWLHYVGARSDVWANRFTAGSGWGTAELIETANAGSALSPQIAADPHGNAHVVWFQSDGVGRNDVWANRYTGGGWGVAELIEADNTAFGAQNVDVAVDPSGNALAVWYLYDGTRYNIWSNRYTPGGGWGAAELIETNDGGGAYLPSIAMDARGNALAVWYDVDGGLASIWSNRFIAGTGWGAAELIETEVGMVDIPEIAVAPTGEALAVWPQSDGARDNIMANRFE